MDHGTPYSLTEEFVSVYRMHTLLPDKILLRELKTPTSADKCPPIQEEYVCFYFTEILDFSFFCFSSNRRNLGTNFLQCLSLTGFI